jgi:hypothetical protein
MSQDLAKRIVDALAHDLSEAKFGERHDDVTSTVAGVVKKPWNGWRRVFGGHGIVAVAAVPGSVADCAGLRTLFGKVRREINDRFVGFAAYKSSYSFVVLVCPHHLFDACPGIASQLKDRTGLHSNIIQGVILVDAETGAVTGDYTRPAQHKGEYDAVVSATRRAASLENRG